MRYTMESLTPFEQTAELGQRLAQSFALNQALEQIAKAEEDETLTAEGRIEVELSKEVLIQALIALAGDDVPEA
tara:strand:- start:154 stop:375 length:222 start_codon:yes stop_codon:yes gene_type:complete